MAEQNAVIQHHAAIPTPPPPPQSKSRNFNLPCQDLLADDRRRDFINTCVPLCKASIRGDWEAAKRILQNNRNLVRYSITENCETALHIAASAESTNFMDELLKMMNKEDLLLQTKSGDTALCLAAAAGNVKLARILVDGNHNLAYSVEYQVAKKLKLKNENPDHSSLSKNKNPDRSSEFRNNENLTAKYNRLKNRNPDHSSGSWNNENLAAKDNTLKNPKPDHTLGSWNNENLAAQDNKLNNENPDHSSWSKNNESLAAEDNKLKNENPDHSLWSKNNENLAAEDNIVKIKNSHHISSSWNNENLAAKDNKLYNENPDHSSWSKNNENLAAEDNLLMIKNPHHRRSWNNENMAAEANKLKNKNQGHSSWSWNKENPDQSSVPTNQKQDQSSESRDENLLTISGREGLMPLSVAALYGKGEMVEYLYHKSNDMGGPEWNSVSKQWLLFKCVDINLFDIALRIIDKHGELGQSENILRALAMKPLAFNESKPQSIFAVIRKSNAKESEALQLLKKVWTNIAERPKDEVDKILKGPGILMNGKLKYNSPILSVATEMGNTEFVARLICEYPDLIWKKNDNNQSIFHIAVSHRQENIYTMLHEIGSMKDLITCLRDMDCNNMLHLVGEGKNQSKDVAGVAFQMQRELLWFKEVESMIPPYYREEKNKDGLTPYELFTNNHKNLVSKGEKWMKDTASQCMVVAALIAIVVFAVAFMIPGGYNQNNGLPVFLRKGPFIGFVILDAISLILSSTSILVFLSILTSRYAQEDFAKSLPQKLWIGLTTLFLSIVTMMIAFSVSFFVLYHEQLIVIAISISIFAVIPIVAFTILHYRLLMDVFQSTRSSRLLFKPKKQLFDYQNPKF